MATVIPDVTPSELLDRFRGKIFRAAPGYPEVIHLRVKDSGGDEWRFSTFYATYSPEDPGLFPGKVISAADLDPSGTLKIGFSDHSEFVVTPIPLEPDDPGEDLETWHLITPEGLSLWYGPRSRWHLGLATDVV